MTISTFLVILIFLLLKSLRNTFVTSIHSENSLSVKYSFSYWANCSADKSNFKLAFETSVDIFGIISHFQVTNQNISKKGSSIKYVRKISWKTNISNPLIRARTCEYQGFRNISFSENFAYVLNGWPQMHKFFFAVDGNYVSIFQKNLNFTNLQFVWNLVFYLIIE